MRAESQSSGFPPAKEPWMNSTYSPRSYSVRTSKRRGEIEIGRRRLPESEFVELSRVTTRQEPMIVDPMHPE